MFAAPTLAQTGPIDCAPIDGLEAVAADQPFRLDFGGPLMQDDSAPIRHAGGVAADDDWRVDFTVWLWVLGVEGDVGARGLQTNVSADFLDILDASDSVVALSGRLEIGPPLQEGRWAGFFDGMYAKLGADDQSGPPGFAQVDATMQLAIVDFGVMYRLGEWTREGNAADNAHGTTLDVYAGARYANVEVDLDPEIAATRSGGADWIDPIVGAKFVLPLSEHWHIMAMGDVGGFGAASDFTWSATAVLGYDFTLFDHPATVYAGYRAMGQDYSEGSGTDRFVWDVLLHGPLLGFSMSF